MSSRPRRSITKLLGLSVARGIAGNLGNSDGEVLETTLGKLGKLGKFKIPHLMEPLLRGRVEFFAREREQSFRVSPDNVVHANLDPSAQLQYSEFRIKKFRPGAFCFLKEPVEVV